MTTEPQSTAADDQAVGEIKFFSPSSRINRLRYWAHSMLVIIPFYIVLAIGALLAVKVSPIFWGLVGIGYIAMIAFSFIVIIQRLHDLNKSGWLSLLAIVPLANLYLMILLIFFAGTPGRNDYGLQTPPNKTWHWVLALIFPVLIAVLGILAAVALPAYQQYVVRAQQHAVDSAAPAVDATDEAAADAGLTSEESSETEETSESEGEMGNEPTDAVVEDKVEDSAASATSETPQAPQ